MTYFGFLVLFLGPPLLLLGWLTYRDRRRGRVLPPSLQTWPAGYIILAHVVVAVLYTTPWDNYLVATRVWWYDPTLVTGILLGWVPIEEYTFFVLQTIMAGLFVLVLARRIKIGDTNNGNQTFVETSVSTPATPFRDNQLRLHTALGVGVLWAAALGIWFLAWRPGTYLALELLWALPPIIFQLGFGADILWSYRRLVFPAISVTTLYLSIGDAVAIGAGTWTINPTQSTAILLGNLPVEEFLFFLVTNTLVVFGMILVLAERSHQRIPTALLRLLGQQSTPSKLESV